MKLSWEIGIIFSRIAFYWIRVASAIAVRLFCLSNWLLKLEADFLKQITIERIKTFQKENDEREDF